MLARDHARNRQVFELVDEGADGHANFDRRAGCALFVGAAAGLAIGGLDAACGFQVEERRDVGVGDEDDFAPASAVTAVGPAVRDELLATKGDDAVPTGARLDFEQGFIDE